MKLAGLDVDAFLRDYWQKRPLLIRNPWVAWTNPLEPDDLAGLACEEEVESRLIMAGREALTVEHGPFSGKRFSKLGKHPWTLLVQAVDIHVPEVAALLGFFRFIPNWRIDDVMVSYASDGGGVRPHFDQYDVFLIQGLGQRRWRIGGVCDAATALLPHDDLRLLAAFEPTEEWVLNPGDMLYLPPRIAHDGVAVGDDCMTYSIGFRAPSQGDLIAGWSDDAIAASNDDDRYADPDLAEQGNPGEILPAAIDRMHAMLVAAMQDGEAFARWFGRYGSTPKYPDLDLTPDKIINAEELRELVIGGATLVRNPASRFSFVRQDGRSLVLFVDGACFDCEGSVAGLAELLCADPHPQLPAAMSEGMNALLVLLINQGSLIIDS